MNGFTTGSTPIRRIYFWLDTSGYGAGVYNIDVGVGKLAFAWLGGLNDNFLSPNIGTLFKHTFDLRLKNISLGPIPGNLALVVIGNFEQGGTFTQDYNVNGVIVPLTNPLKFDAAWGIGGGASTISSSAPEAPITRSWPMRWPAEV